MFGAARRALTAGPAATSAGQTFDSKTEGLPHCDEAAKIRE